MYAQTMRNRTIKDLPTQVNILKLLLKILKHVAFFPATDSIGDSISEDLPCEVV